MSAKTVSKSSDKTVIRARVPFRTVDDEPIFLTGLIGFPVSSIAVACPLNLAAHFDLLSSFLCAGGLVGTVMAGIFALEYAGEVAEQGENNSPGAIPTWRSLANTVFPFGQKIKMEKKTVRFNADRPNISRLESGRKSSPGSDSTHEVATTIKYTPLGAYIEQEFTTQPTKVWDDAFKTTLAVHAFREKNATDAKKASSIRFGK